MQRIWSQRKQMYSHIKIIKNHFIICISARAIPPSFALEASNKIVFRVLISASRLPMRRLSRPAAWKSDNVSGGRSGDEKATVLAIQSESFTLIQSRLLQPTQNSTFTQQEVGYCIFYKAE